jgi:hypothetical protein
MDIETQIQVCVKMVPNQSVQPTGGSRFAQSAFGRQWRLPPVADAFRRCGQSTLFDFNPFPFLQETISASHINCLLLALP